ncbi:GH92 family glycosyl hydrolase [Limibacter armeniacum]|uniref:GH92 family glycosyl hydrolase n=1 Tax=Limibacter armeniacum TaxID=466084 RepID=UPI002FE62A21
MKASKKRFFENHKWHIWGTALLAVCLGSCTTPKNTTQEIAKTPAEEVDVFIGTGEHGHTYPGATVPFGMVQLSPNNGKSGWDWVSGYHYSDSIIVGFTHTALSGTGIGDLSDILIMPTTASVDLTKKIKSRDDYDYKAKYSHQQEVARPGFYQVTLQPSQIKAELTTTERSGMHRYTFPEIGEASVVMDLGFAINWDGPYDTEIRVEAPTIVSGYRFSKGWAANQQVYFVMEFSKPIKSYKLVEGTSLANENAQSVMAAKTKGQFFFDVEADEEVLVKVGLSTVSVEGAKNNLAKENPDWDFETIKNKAFKLWDKELNQIQVSADTDSLKSIFYTALYHTKLAPTILSDVDGQYRGADQQVHKTAGTYYSTFSLWDTFRANNPLFTILDADRVSDMVNTMLRHYDENGRLPVWALAANETDCMTGNHSIPVITDAILKGVKGFDYDKAFEAMKETQMKDIRGLNHYKKYGYIPLDKQDESVTITLEYAFDDWCVAQVAQKLGKQSDYKAFLKRSEAWQYLFDKETGFMRGKDSKENWRTPFDPKRSEHRKDTDYTEGNAWQHSWFVLQDVEGLIKAHGGNKAFVNKLDLLFSESSEITGDHASPDISGLIGQYAHGNEPSHHITYLYALAGAPEKTAEKVHEIMTTQYSAQPEGISGNEDCGQMSAWYVMSAMGIYPVNPASGQYVIGTPLFDRVQIQLKNGKTLEITTNNKSDQNIYVKSVKLNGKVLKGHLITHQEILNGGKLEFEMSAKPSI